MRKIDFNLIGICICTIVVVCGIFLSAIATTEKQADIAKCESMGGVYGGGKCFVNGFEVDNK